MTLKLVIFDLDGTLLDTLDDLGAAVNYAMRQRGFPQHTRTEYMMMVGHGARNLMSQAVPAEHRNDESLIDAALADFRNYYNTHIDLFTKPFPGVPQLLENLYHNGVKLAVASNKFQEGTEHLIKEFFPEIPFVAVLGNRPGHHLKPDPEVVDEVLRMAGLSELISPRSLRGDGGKEVDREIRRDAVMVGDSDTDMDTAANGGIRGIAVGWGYRNMNNIEGVTVANSIEELQRLLFMPTETPTLPQDSVVWQDPERKLYLVDDQPILQYKGKNYTFACQPYEPMAIIKRDGKPVAYLHNAFNPDVVCQEFMENQNYLVRTISGRHHDAERFCRLLCTAVDYGFDRDVDKAEDKMLELLVQEQGIQTIQFEPRDFHCSQVLYEGVYVLLGYFENLLSKANNVSKIYSIAFGFPERNYDFYEYYLIAESEYNVYRQWPEKRRWKSTDAAFDWLNAQLKGRKQVLCNEFNRNPATYKPYFRLAEIPLQ